MAILTSRAHPKIKLIRSLHSRRPRDRSRLFLVEGGAATDYREARYHGPIALLMGSERVGLSAEEQTTCDMMVAIPMAGRCESHHVVVATALVLYEIARQGEAQARCGTTAKGMAEVAGNRD